MEERGKPQTDKYNEITNNWKYDVSCTCITLPVWELENFKRKIFVAQSVQNVHVKAEVVRSFHVFATSCLATVLLYSITENCLHKQAYKYLNLHKLTQISASYCFARGHIQDMCISNHPVKQF
jgi:hypothetical protein